MVTLLTVIGRLIEDAFRWVTLLLRSTEAVQAENLLLRRQLALYIERGRKPPRIDPATRVSLVVLSHLFDWRSALLVVQPATLLRWRRAGWKLLWQVKSRRGRPRIPEELRALIRRMATENFLWGEERIANELLLKLGIRVSPRTVRKCMPKHPLGRPHRDQRWSTFLKNHAVAILDDDLLAVTGAKSQMLTFRTAARRIRRICALGFEALGSSIASADAVRGWSLLPHSRDVQVTPTAAMHSQPIPPHLMTSSNGWRPQSALSPHVRDPPRPPAYVSEFHWFFTPRIGLCSKRFARANRCRTGLQRAHAHVCAAERVVGAAAQDLALPHGIAEM